MNAAMIRRLAKIADKPGASGNAQLIATCAICRLNCQELRSEADRLKRPTA
jgi:hypothetical protein